MRRVEAYLLARGKVANHERRKRLGTALGSAPVEAKAALAVALRNCAGVNVGSTNALTCRGVVPS